MLHSDPCGTFSLSAVAALSGGVCAAPFSEDAAVSLLVGNGGTPAPLRNAVHSSKERRVSCRHGHVNMDCALSLSCCALTEGERSPEQRPHAARRMRQEQMRSRSSMLRTMLQRCVGLKGRPERRWTVVRTFTEHQQQHSAVHRSTRRGGETLDIQRERRTNGMQRGKK